MVKRWTPPAALALLCLFASSCRPLLREVFRPPTVKLVDVGISGNSFLAPRGPLEAILFLRVTNPNDFALTVSEVAYSATIGTRRVAGGESTEQIRIEPSGDTTVRIPVQLAPKAFAAAMREVLDARALSYEFNGSVGVVAPVVGVVRVPFSRTGTIDPAEFLRRKGIGFN
ncbi:MAG: LEA type 2 family protein [Verrucomicrobiota bacterium]